MPRPQNNRHTCWIDEHPLTEMAMSKFEEAVLELDALNKTLLFKKRGGGVITQDEYGLVQNLVKKIHLESACRTPET